MQLSDNVNIPVAESDTVTFGGVGTVVYRDTIQGVRFTVHTDETEEYGWIVQHAPTERNDSDGVAAYRSPLLFGWESLNRVWDETREALGCKPIRVGVLSAR